MAAHIADGKTPGQARELAVRPSRVMVWRPDQLGVFLDVAAGDRLYGLYHVIAYRGLRRGEAAGLAWEDVDLDGAALTVRWQRVQLGWEVFEDTPKSEAGDRTVPLDAGTVAALRAHRRAQLAERLTWGPAWTDSGKVFTRENGEPLHPAALTDHFRELTVAADLPPVRLHDLRHGAASLMQMSRIASGASFDKIRGLVLPATSPFGLDQGRWRMSRHTHPDQAKDPAVALNATILQLILWHPAPDSCIRGN